MTILSSALKSVIVSPFSSHIAPSRACPRLLTQRAGSAIGMINFGKR
jgi:hypothetical protein